MPHRFEDLNTAPLHQALAMLEGVYEHSPWIAQAALAARPYRSLAQLKHALAAVVTQATEAAQLALIRAHPELAGKAMLAKTLTAESNSEQNAAGLTGCSPAEFERLHQLNAAYNAKFGWPFILAVRGPRGAGMSRAQIMAAFERRLAGHAAFEQAECLRNIHRIAELRLDDLFEQSPTQGHILWDWHQALAQHSEPEALARGELTVTYLTPAHRACAAELVQRMHACGFDDVFIDAVGNVVGRYGGTRPDAPRLLTGSHFDTVRNGGKFDGRLGILAPMMAVEMLARSGRRLPFGLEVVGFAEEEGQRFKATFLGSSALVGDFDPAWLAQQDANGHSLQAVMQANLAALATPADEVTTQPAAEARSELSPRAAQTAPQTANLLARIAAERRNPAHYLGFVEIHIEQGPVLGELNLPLGVVTSINGSVRMMGEITGTACHAGTTPMNRRQDAATALAELALFVEARARQDADSVATIGMLHVPSGSINVVPGRCNFSLDMRAPTDAQRDALVTDITTELERICARRGVSQRLETVLRAGAAPSAPEWAARWAAAVAATGLPVHRMPSGAGHDAMKLHHILPQAMLFVRGEHAGISHNPLESTHSHDLQLALDAFNHLLEGLAREHAPASPARG